jgi:hypothetical protein
MSGEPRIDEAERLRRWRLVLGAPADDACGGLEGDDARADEALARLYDDAISAPRSAGLGRSAPNVARWLGDIRSYFPKSVVHVVQQDAMDRLGLAALLGDPQVLEELEPDLHLVSTLLSLQGAIPDETKATARMVVRQVVDDILARVQTQTRATVSGAVRRAARTHRPRPRDIDWPATIRANLRHYLPEHKTIVPRRLVGHARGSASFEQEIVLAIDQSGSMASSVVYSAIFGSVLASVPALRTSVVAFDTEVVDLTEHLHDPVDLLFGVRLGGGTDINRAIAYCQGLIRQPSRSSLFLISDLIEGGVREDLLRRMRELRDAGVTVIVLLALSDDGAPLYDEENAHALASLGIPAFACTPDAFPELVAAAIDGRDLTGLAGGAMG